MTVNHSCWHLACFSGITHSFSTFSCLFSLTGPVQTSHSSHVEFNANYGLVFHTALFHKVRLKLTFRQLYNTPLACIWKVSCTRTRSGHGTLETVQTKCVGSSKNAIFMQNFAWNAMSDIFSGTNLHTKPEELQLTLPIPLYWGTLPQLCTNHLLCSETLQRLLMYSHHLHQQLVKLLFQL